MLDYTGAQKILAANARSFGKEWIGLDQVSGRTLAETILADRDYPPFNRSSMDGYAIRYSDFEKGIRHFSITGTIYAGEVAAIPPDATGSPDDAGLITDQPARGQCYKIMTGAPVPPGADTVIRREDTDESEGTVYIRPDICRPFQNISKQGEDLRSGDLAIGRACLCEPPLIGLLASLGKDRLLVERLPRVALLTTGNEIVEVGGPISAFQIRNSNRWLLQSFLKKWWITPSHYEHIPDDRPVLQSALAALLGPTGSFFDIIILSGGVSMGDADYVPGVLEELGVQKLFHKIAIKPGKPVWCGLAPARGASPASVPPSSSSPPPAPIPPSPHTMIFALPGNPFSCLVNFVLLIQPYLHACFGLPAPAPQKQPLRVFKKKNTPLDEFFPVRTAAEPGPVSGLQPVLINGSGDIRLGMQADALALHPAGENDLPEGTMVLYYNL